MRATDTAFARRGYHSESTGSFTQSTEANRLVECDIRSSTPGQPIDADHEDEDACLRKPPATEHGIPR